jgi:hypothetical protein
MLFENASRQDYDSLDAVKFLYFASVEPGIFEYLTWCMGHAKKSEKQNLEISHARRLCHLPRNTS